MNLALQGQPSHLANGSRGRSQLLPYQPHSFTTTTGADASERFLVIIFLENTREFPETLLPVLVLNFRAISALQYCTGNFFGSDKPYSDSGLVQMNIFILGGFLQVSFPPQISKPSDGGLDTIAPQSRSSFLQNPPDRGQSRK